MKNKKRLCSLAPALMVLISCTSCTYESSKLPNPVADAYAAKMKNKSLSVPPISIKRHVSSEGVLFPSSKILSPESELLKRRLTFLETHTLDEGDVQDRSKMESQGVTRYHFAEINSDECKEFRARVAEFPFVLTALQKLGLPDHLCIAKATHVKPNSRYFYYWSHVTTRHILGEDWSYKLVLADYESRDVVAEANEFGYCDTKWCWHGFRTHNQAEVDKMWALVEGIPDKRLTENN